jgi:hypothetical protein
MRIRRPGRKLLVASLGVAAVNYVYACNNGTTTPNDGGKDAPMEAIVANLVPPPQDGGVDTGTSDASTDTTVDSPDDAAVDG